MCSLFSPPPSPAPPLSSGSQSWYILTLFAASAAALSCVLTLSSSNRTYALAGTCIGISSVAFVFAKLDQPSLCLLAFLLHETEPLRVPYFVRKELSRVFERARNGGRVVIQAHIIATLTSTTLIRSMLATYAGIGLEGEDVRKFNGSSRSPRIIRQRKRLNHKHQPNNTDDAGCETRRKNETQPNLPPNR